jgi:hypothetical protein
MPLDTSTPQGDAARTAANTLSADKPPATQPSTQPAKSRTEIKIKELEQFYARTYGEPLNLPERLPKEIAIISLSRIDSADPTQRLLDVFKLKDRDPIVWWLAWEALHARTGSMSPDQRQRWATGGLLAALAPGGFPGTTVAPLLRALAEHHPTAYEDQPHRLAIRVIAEATAAGVRAVADAIGDKGGLEAANLKVAQQYVEAFASLAKTTNTLILPASAGDVAGMVATAMTVLDKTRQTQAAVRA